MRSLLLGAIVCLTLSVMIDLPSDPFVNLTDANGVSVRINRFVIGSEQRYLCAGALVLCASVWIADGFLRKRKTF